MNGWDWQGREFQVKVLYSHKGIATQILVERQGSNFLLDCGDGTLRDLLSLEVEWVHRLRAILLSHEHPDHSAGLYALLAFLRLQGRTTALVLGTPARHLWQTVTDYRDGFLGGFPFELDYWPCDPAWCLTLGTTELRAFAVPHRERTSVIGTAGLVPAVGFSLTSPSRERVVYSGDTGWFDALPNLFRGADLGIIEATFDQPKGEGRHLTRRQAGELAALARQALLVHR